MTPLMYAVKDNRTAFLDRMVELGCDPTARNQVSAARPCTKQRADHVADGGSWNAERHSVWPDGLMGVAKRGEGHPA